MSDSSPQFDVFSPSYLEARAKFCEATTRAGWEHSGYPTGETGPDGTPLTLDVASCGDPDAKRVLLVSSGLHGVEGYFGSALQIAALQNWAPETTLPPQTRIVFLHGLNPYGFAWIRRVDSHNIDPNRNFLLPEDSFDRPAPRYRRYDRFLNPNRPPAPFDTFRWIGAAALLILGPKRLAQAIAAGQHEYPDGLFFGGQDYGPTQTLYAAHWKNWVGDDTQVLHIDFHTGLGKSATWKLLLDTQLTDAELKRLQEWFGEGSVARGDPEVTYETSGSIGRWCRSSHSGRYVYVCAEFGTFDALSVLSALRSENQAHRYCQPDEPAWKHAKSRLKEIFCPASPVWRGKVLDEGTGLIRQAVDGYLPQGF
ncbi:hypothetical protein Mal4_34810 [Maioricimonas rarisocia]|uniref:DUF2817 domain-containing protein n=1 Tax=Maioricimonas rarisocia TaxID=2528026 RepID=A0A517Z9I2_9PLAN|nr:DUF2817 domain-containing protein [Maioricimonas rarisocia]QDU39145.1 hypothetical protein Mal4_34810 [Maioricimonas rarisocia]